MNRIVAAKCPAKINLFLDILRRRSDGYHDIHTAFHLITLSDELTIEALGPRASKEDVLFEEFHLVHPTLKVDSNNLVVRALQALDIAAPHPLPAFRVRLDKHLPIGAGLGGGSSDAATALKLANEFLSPRFSSEGLQYISAGIGSDCAFFVGAGEAAEGSGRGETLSPLPSVNWPCLVVLPPFGISTKEAYSGLSLEMLGSHSDLGGLKAWLTGARGTPPKLENTFEKALEPHHPALREIREALNASGAILARLSGSGSAVFGIFDDEAQCKRAEAALGKKWNATACRLGAPE